MKKNLLKIEVKMEADWNSKHKKRTRKYESFFYATIKLN